MKNESRGLRKSRRACAALYASALLSICGTANAGYVANESTPTSIKNVTGNTTQFAIYVTGGSGPCINTWVVFPLSAAPDADTHKRAYATALMAVALGMKVIIHNYTSDSCLAASYIEAHY